MCLCIVVSLAFEPTPEKGEGGGDGGGLRAPAQPSGAAAGVGFERFARAGGDDERLIVAADRDLAPHIRHFTDHDEVLHVERQQALMAAIANGGFMGLRSRRGEPRPGEPQAVAFAVATTCGEGFDRHKNGLGRGESLIFCACGDDPEAALWRRLGQRGWRRRGA